QISEVCHDLFLAVTAGITDNADRRFGGAAGKKYLSRLLQLLHPPFAARIVEGNDEVGFGCRLETLPDFPPGGQKVRKGDDGKVMHKRRAEDGCRSLDR